MTGPAANRSGLRVGVQRTRARPIEPAHAPAALRAHRQRQRQRAVAARVVAAVGVLSLVSALVPPLWRRVHIIGDVLPLMIGPSHLLSRAAATALVWVSLSLLMTSRGLRRGQQLAWAGTVALLLTSTVLHLSRGLDLAEVILVVAGVAWLLARRKAFPVRPTRAAVRRVLVWAVPGVGIVGGLSLGLAMLVRRDRGHVPRGLLNTDHIFTPMATAMLIALVGGALWVLLSPHRSRRPSPAEHREERERARALIQVWSAGTLDYFALRDDKDWYVTGSTVVAHTVRFGVCLVSPDPIGPSGERLGAWLDFLAYAELRGWSVAVLGASAESLPMYAGSGLRAMYLGDEALVDCPSFSLLGRERRGLRQAVNRVARAGCTTTFHDPAHLDGALREQVLEVAEQSRRGDVERGFSMTLSRLFDPDDTGLLLSVTRTGGGRVEAFCQWVPAPGIDGWSLDVMRRRLGDDVPNGVMDACVAATIEEVARRGQRGLDLNFAVMRERLETEPSGPLGGLTRSLLVQMSERTQMTSLSRFNEKFGPTWVPRFIVLDAAEFVATQALVMAGAEGVTELPLIGRFLGPAPRDAPSTDPT